MGKKTKVKNHYIFKINDFLIENYANYQKGYFQKEQQARRQRGGKFELKDHIKGLIYSQLSAQRKWCKIEPKLPEIDKIFHDYNVEWIKSQSGEEINIRIKDIKCGNIILKRAMEALQNNINVFERIEADYGSIEKYIASDNIDVIVNKISNPSSKYKLKMIGSPLAYEYLRNVGIDAAKPDIQLRRFLGSERMGRGNNKIASEREVIEQIELLAKETGLSKFEIDRIIWYFCADCYGEICTENPKCDKCPIRDECKYEKK